MYFQIIPQLAPSYKLKKFWFSTSVPFIYNPPPAPATSYPAKGKQRLRDAGNPKRNVLTAGPYPQPGKSLIYNPTWETTGKQQEVIFKEPVATGSKCRGSKHVPIKVRQLQKNHKGTAPLRAEQEWRGGAPPGEGDRRRRKGREKHQNSSSCPVEQKTWWFCVVQQGEKEGGKGIQNIPFPELAFLS